MPACVAVGCSTRADKGGVLKTFPKKDLKRRQIWIDRVNRRGWTPTKYSALCERHFSEDQWEGSPCEDGRRKLKNTAVPSIFCVDYPPNEDVVAKDHAYCVLGYRKIYDNAELDEEVAMPIEHIKVEVNEDMNFSSELAEEEDECDEMGAENIQCTPDISVYPEKGEPDPIEMVDCEEDEMNANTAEPSDDPLAISAEDVVQASGVVPHFGANQKYLFVHKETTKVSSLPHLVKGEPVVVAEQPRLKVMSPDRLMKPVSSTPVTFTFKPIQFMSPSFKIHSKQVQIPRVEKSKTYIHDMLNGRYTSPNKTNIIVGSTSSLKPAPEYLRPQSVVNTSLPSDSGSPFKPINHGNLLNSILKVNEKKSYKIPMKKLLSMGGFAKLENILVDHHYSKQPLWKPSTMDGIKVDYVPKPVENSVKLLGNNDVKMWLSSKRSNGEVDMERSHFGKISIKHSGVDNKNSSPKVQYIRSSSVIVVKPFEKTQSYSRSPQPVKRKQKLTMFTCHICQVSFLTPATLQIHMISHKDLARTLTSDSGTDSAEETKDHDDDDVEQRQEFTKGDDKPMRKRNREIRVPQRFKNDMVCIPNLSALRNLRTNGFVKLSNFAPAARSNSRSRAKVSKKKTLSKFRKRNKKHLYLPKPFSEDDRIIKSFTNSPKNITDKIELKDDTLQTKTSDQLNVSDTAEVNISINIKKEKECYVDDSNRKLNLNGANKRPVRNKKKTYKLQMLLANKLKMRKAKKEDTLLKKSPIVLLPKVDMETINNKIKINSVLESTSNDGKRTTINSLSEELSLECIDLEKQAVASPKSQKEKSSFKGKNIGKQTLTPYIHLTSDLKVSDKYLHSDKEKTDLKNVLNDTKDKLKKSESGNDAKVKCSVCGLLVTGSHLRGHMSLHSSPEYSCDVCNKRFPKRFLLRRHTTSDHKVVKSFQCPRRDCSRTFETKRLLDKHTRTHKK